MKTCSKCKTDKPTADFPKDKNRKDVLACWCKSCYSEYQKANRAAASERNRRYREANPDKSKEYWSRTKEKVARDMTTPAAK